MLITHQELFHHSVRDLKKRIASGTKYDLIRGCALCRQLIVEASALVHKVRRGTNKKLYFTIADYTGHPVLEARMQIGFTTIEPNRHATSTKEIRLDPFLKTKIMYYGKIDFTVYDILIAASHYYGGVHSGDPNEKQKYLNLLNEGTLSKVQLTFKAMRAICKVVAKALDKLDKEL